MDISVNVNGNRNLLLIVQNNDYSQQSEEWRSKENDPTFTKNRRGRREKSDQRYMKKVKIKNMRLAGELCGTNKLRV